MPPPDLDAWLPRPQVRTIHRRVVDARPDALWAAAQGVLISDTPALGRILRWRIPGTSPDQPYAELFRRYPFTVLAQGADWTLSGLCGRIWTLARDYPAIDRPEAFRDWRRPGTVRVLFAHWVEPVDPHRTALVSECRVEPVDRRARLQLGAVWAIVGRFERLIGDEALHVAGRRATPAWRPALRSSAGA